MEKRKKEIMIFLGMSRRDSKSKNKSNKVIIFVIIIILLFLVFSKMNKPINQKDKPSQTTQNDCNDKGGVTTCLSAY